MGLKVAPMAVDSWEVRSREVRVGPARYAAMVPQAASSQAELFRAHMERRHSDQ